MSSTNEATPTRLEIERQLDWILRSAKFAKRRVPEFLQFVVKSGLDGVAIDDKSVFATVFSDLQRNPDSPNARVLAKDVRDALSAYYGEEGAEDPVVISLLSGRGYKVKCEYNPDSASIHLLREARSCLDRLFSNEDLTRVNATFAEFALAPAQDDKSSLRRIALLPQFLALGAEAAFASALCTGEAVDKTLVEAELFARWALRGTSAQDRVELEKFGDKEDLSGFDRFSEVNLQGDPQLWRAHLILGAVECCRFQWEAARTHFNRAREINRLEASLHPYYGAFLAATGHVDRALENALVRFRSNPEDSFAGITVMLFKYIKGEDPYSDRPRLARLGRLTPLPKYRNIWLARIVDCCVALKNPQEPPYEYQAVSAVKDALRLFNEDSFLGLYVLALSRYVNESRSPDDREISDLNKAMRQLDFGNTSPVQLALGHMASGKYVEAIQDLHRACNENNPLMVWLHLWPVFDPLRECSEFSSLLERMNLPPVQ